MGMHNHTKSAISGGNIRRSRVVYMSTDFTVLEMSVNTSFPVYGVSQEWSRQAPGTPFDTSLYAAQSGDELLVYVAGSTALCECGNTVTAGKMVTADSTARIADATGAPPWSFFAVGKALESGAAGDVVRVEIGGR